MPTLRRGVPTLVHSETAERGLSQLCLWLRSHGIYRTNQVVTMNRRRTGWLSTGRPSVSVADEEQLLMIETQDTGQQQAAGRR